MAKIDPDNPFRCEIGCTCGAAEDEGCEFKVRQFRLSGSNLFKMSMLEVLYKLDLYDSL